MTLLTMAVWKRKIIIYVLQFAGGNFPLLAPVKYPKVVPKKVCE